MSAGAARTEGETQRPSGSWLKRLFRMGRQPAAPSSADDILLDLASRMDSDGGMPGKDRESRAIATVIALLAFFSQGHTTEQGAFRSPVARLASFLKSLTGLSSHHQLTVVAVIELAHQGTAPAGEWIKLAHTSGNHWKEVDKSLLGAQGVRVSLPGRQRRGPETDSEQYAPYCGSSGTCLFGTAARMRPTLMIAVGSSPSHQRSRYPDTPLETVGVRNAKCASSGWHDAVSPAV